MHILWLQFVFVPLSVCLFELCECQSNKGGMRYRRFNASSTTRTAKNHPRAAGYAVSQGHRQVRKTLTNKRKETKIFLLALIGLFPNDGLSQIYETHQIQQYIVRLWEKDVHKKNGTKIFTTCKQEMRCQMWSISEVPARRLPLCKRNPPPPPHHCWQIGFKPTHTHTHTLHTIP